MKSYRAHQTAPASVFPAQRLDDEARYATPKPLSSRLGVSFRGKRHVNFLQDCREAAFHLLEFVSLLGLLRCSGGGCRRMEALAAQYNPMKRSAMSAIGTSSGAVGSSG